jgi:4'-phosphopantetheinyl transferase
MNIIFEEKGFDYHISIADINEDPDTLYQELKDDLDHLDVTYYLALKSEKRKLEWLGVRKLLKKMSGKYYKINYTHEGNPVIVNDTHISITHSKQYIGIIISKHIETGIDIEVLSPKILHTAHKFITLQEIELFEEEYLIKKIYLNWCGKETLYKIHKKGGVDFKSNFKIWTDQIQSFGKADAHILIGGNKNTYHLSYRFLSHQEDEILVVWH